MAYTVNNLHVFKSEILPKWMTNIFCSQFAQFVLLSWILNYIMAACAFVVAKEVFIMER